MLARRTLSLVPWMLVLGGCASSGITSSWVAPDATGPLGFQKTLVVVMHPVDAVRRIGENRLVQRIGRGRAVASHTLLSLDELKDLQAARASVEDAGFDGAVLMRVIGRDQVLSYQEGYRDLKIQALRMCDHTVGIDAGNVLIVPVEPTHALQLNRWHPDPLFVERTDRQGCTTTRVGQPGINPLHDEEKVGRERLRNVIERNEIVEEHSDADRGRSS